MTDEQIMIDGVDVSKCRYFRPGSALTCSRMYGGACDNKYSNELCYFKQLARKTAECEGLQARNEIVNKLLENLGLSASGELKRVSFYVNKLKQKCEELKKTGNKYYVQVLDERDKLREDVAKFNEKLELIRTCGTEPLKAECFRYRKALEEIEEYCKKERDTWCDTHCDLSNKPCSERYCYPIINLTDILDIIRKAKGEED